MPRASVYSVDETIALLQRTALPTIVVEGNDDIIVYRRFEEKLSHLGVSVLPVGGRKRLLEVFARRTELPSKLRLAFVADSDVWVNTGIPPAYLNPSLVLTWGYSIENDVFVDGDLLALLTTKERFRFERELEQFSDWYALALSRHLADNEKPISLHPSQVLDPDQLGKLLSLGVGEVFPTALRAQLASAYQQLIRGKSLLALFLRQASYSGRDPKHSTKSLLEWVAAKPGPRLNRLSSELEALMS